MAGKTPAEAHEVLARPDVLVTNQSDKTLQLGKIEKLNEMVIEAFEMPQPAKQRSGAGACDGIEDIKFIDGALAVGKQAGVAPANIKAVEEACGSLLQKQSAGRTLLRRKLRQADIAAAEAKRRADLAAGAAKRVKLRRYWRRSGRLIAQSRSLRMRAS